MALSLSAFPSPPVPETSEFVTSVSVEHSSDKIHCRKNPEFWSQIIVWLQSKVPSVYLYYQGLSNCSLRLIALADGIGAEVEIGAAVSPGVGTAAGRTKAVESGIAGMEGPGACCLLNKEI